MHWIALPRPADDAQPEGLPAEAGAWWALRFSPRVALIDESLLIEVSTTERLWGGLPALLDLLMAHVRHESQAHQGAGQGGAHGGASGATGATVIEAARTSQRAAPQRAALQGMASQGLASSSAAAWALPTLPQAPTALQALAQLRLLQAGRPVPQRLPHDLPLRTLTDLGPHLRQLEHMGCRTWGALRALPRAGVARRFGAGLLRTLDQAFGDVPHQPRWVELPERFEMQAELPALVESAGALVWSAGRLLSALQHWLQGRHQGVLALRLEWQHHLRRLDGVQLPAWGGMDLRTAEPAQQMAHMQRLLTERLAHCKLAAPVDRIALRVVQTGPIPAGSANLLPPGPDDAVGDAWHELQERWAARLGAHRVQAVRLHADHRPERMHGWHAVADGVPAGSADAVMPALTRATDPRGVLWPTWLTQTPQPLRVQHHRPWLQGPLAFLAGPQRFEAGWWESAAPPGARRAGDCATGLARREYFIAHNEAVGAVWVFRDLLQTHESQAWFLHGYYG